MARKYIKKSEYWNNRKQSPVQDVVGNSRAEVDGIPSFAGDESHTSLAACGGGATSQTFRDNFAPTIRESDRYQNIRQGLIPFEERGGYHTISGALDCVYRAYFNIQILRNCINMMVDFTASKLHVISDNKTVKDFFTDWLATINADDLISQFFMEYYRSGNVFIYKFNGKIRDKDFETLRTTLSAKSQTVPIKYVILNPMQVQLQYGPGFKNNYVKLLSNYEIARLKNPITEEDKQIFNALPEIAKENIKNSAGLQYVFIPLDPKRLFYVFYKKQSYEPFAVPPTFGVLNDIEWKLELKKMDMSLSRTVEQVLLLVTAGEKADQWNKGSSGKVLERLQSIFKNQTIGRVLVADHTTKAEWKIPDLKELLGIAKYERVDKDIKEGLQYMFFGDEKFANATIKIKVFIETLKEGRKMFLNNFLIPEASGLAQDMGFKTVPEFKFEEINLQDEALMHKIYVRMAELGILTPSELTDAMQSGILPTKESSEVNQKEYVKQRDDKMYTPLLGGSNKEEEGRPPGSNSPQSTKKISPQGTSAEDRFGMMRVADNLLKAQQLKDKLVKAAKKKYKLKELNEVQLGVMESMAKSILVNESEDQWDKQISTYLTEPKEIAKEVAGEIDEISIKYDTDSWISTILYKSRISENLDK